VSSNVYGFSRTFHGAWRSVDGAVSNVSGALKSVNKTFKNALVELLGVSTFITNHCHLVIPRFYYY
jgi:hypothetical protein